MPIDIIRVEQKTLPYMPHGRDMSMSFALIYIQISNMIGKNLINREFKCKINLKNIYIRIMPCKIVRFQKLMQQNIMRSIKNQSSLVLYRLQVQDRVYFQIVFEENYIPQTHYIVVYKTIHVY